MGVMTEINELLGRAVSRGFTRTSLARACDLSPNALRELDLTPSSESFLGSANLTISTIRAIERVVGAPAVAPAGPRPIHAVDIPKAVAMLGDHRISRALNMWEVSGDASLEFADLGQKPSLVSIRDDGDYHLVWGDHAKPYGFLQDQSTGISLSSFEDKPYEEFCRQRLLEVFALNEPQVRAIDAQVLNETGLVSLRYWSLLLPLGGDASRPPTAVMGVVLLESERQGHAPRA